MTHMIQMFFDTRALLRVADRRTLYQHSLELDYLLHSQLYELFGNNLAPKPFAVTSTTGPRLDVLGYSDEPATTLQQHAQAKVLPLVYQTVDWDAFASKPMPSHFPVGSRFRFRVRTCPVVRKGRGSQAHKAGAEVDVFLCEVERHGPEARLDRNTVYADWMRGEMQRLGGAECTDVRVTAFSLSKFLRRDKERKGFRIERPDVVFEGALEVTDAEAFQRTVRRGIGRHRSFGFGMLLLK